jgi:hypothetical protein
MRRRRRRPRRGAVAPSGVRDVVGAERQHELRGRFAQPDVEGVGDLTVVFEHQRVDVGAEAVDRLLQPFPVPVCAVDRDERRDVGHR